MKITVKNAHKIDLATLSHEDLLSLTQKLVQSRVSSDNAQKEHNKTLKEQVQKQAEVNSVMLPEVATLVQMLAERAGLAHEPCVKQAVKAIGNQTYVQWSGIVEKITQLDTEAKSVVDPRAGNAEMVMAAPYADAIERLQETVTYGGVKNKALRDDIQTLISGSRNVFADAIQSGFKSLGIEAVTAIKKTELEDTPTIEQLNDILMDAFYTADFGVSMLRKDLRAEMYNRVFESLQLAAAMSNKISNEKRKAESKEEVFPF